MSFLVNQVVCCLGVIGLLSGSEQAINTQDPVVTINLGLYGSECIVPYNHLRAG
jgi:hypothetical protein